MVSIDAETGEGANSTTECKESKACAPIKHHFDECVERVTGNADEKAPHEDCVEECMFTVPFFPFAPHCIALQSMGLGINNHSLPPRSLRQPMCSS